QAIKADQQLQDATDRAGGPEDLKDPAKNCPGDWLIRTVKVEAEDYTEWPAGLSTEALLSGLPLASACKSEGRIPGPNYKDGAAGLGELSGLALHQWQMLSEDKPLGCPRCEHPAAPLGGSLGDPRPRPFACLQCGKAFGKKAHLTRHARVHTGERPFACTHCGRRFSQKIHLGSHERVHTGERPFPCDRCPKSFRKKTHLVRHQLTHTGERPHVCTLCPRSFVHRRHLLRHQRLHEEEAARVGDPAELGQAAPSYGNGLELGLVGNVPPSGENLAASVVLGQNCRVQGDRAQVGFPYGPGMELGKFLPSCVGHVEPDQGPFLFKAEPELGGVPGAEREDRPLGEEDAGASQPPEEKPFLCSDCGKAFAWRKNLASHQRLHSHAGQRPFACPLCGRAFSRKSHLARHEAVHTGLRPHACTQCPRRFSSKTNLVRHQAVHTGLRPYICTHCARSFSRKTHLLRHERTHTSTPLPSTTGWVTTLPQSSLLQPIEQRPPLLLPMALESPWQ
uniref:Zinc finger protein 467 n=1 Tax=Pseudonaja textilis TaxID=8673 RepID=A0A670ZJZ8_PSETE